MIKRLLLSTVLTAATALVQAQTYQDKALEIQKIVWDNPSPGFTLTDAPATYRNESAVVLAHSFMQERTSKSKFKYLLITATVVKQITSTLTIHDRVKINDKAALKNFSTLEYQKKLDNTLNLGIARFNHKNETFVGVKIIKPGGRQVMVNTSEEVLTKNTNKDQQGKLAIPDLQTGDIIDYYISTYKLNDADMDDNFASNDRVFTLAGEYPILNYTLSFRFDKNTRVRYLLANGAPALQTSIGNDGDQLATLTLKDIPKVESSIWTSVYRQYPYIELSYMAEKVQDKTDITSAIAKSSRLEDNIAFFKGNYKLDARQLYKPYKKQLQEHFGSSRQLKSAPTDSILHAIYNLWKYNTFGSYTAADLENTDYLNYRTASSKFSVIVISQLLKDLDIEHRILAVAPRTGNTLSNTYNYADFETIIMVNPEKPAYLCFNDVANHYNEIPPQFQGERASILDIPSLKYANVLKSHDWELPVAVAEQNGQEEQLKVALQPDNMQKLKIERTVKQMGAMRHIDQKRLLSAGEVDKIYMTWAKGDPLGDRLRQDVSTKKLGDAFNQAFAKAATNRKDAFTAEIKEQFDQEPAQLSNYRITNAALDNTNPGFEYAGTFVFDNFVKKAGSNYIIDMGKLAGSFLKLDETDRKRTIDVYMPYARSFKYTIQLSIPVGYQVKGLDELKHQKSNKTGLFTSAASVNGNTLTVVVNRIYSHNFEKAADWPLVTEIVDEAYNFNNQKILLEKQGS